MRPIDADKVIPAIYNKGLHLKYEQISDMSDAITLFQRLIQKIFKKQIIIVIPIGIKVLFGNAIYAVEKLKVLRTLNLWDIVFAHIVD